MIQQRRSTLRITQAQVGRATLHSGAYISALERGWKAGEPYLGSPSVYAQVALALGMTAQEWRIAADRDHYTPGQRIRLRLIAEEIATRVPPSFEQDVDEAVKVITDLRRACSLRVWQAALVRCGLMRTGSDA